MFINASRTNTRLYLRGVISDVHSSLWQQPPYSLPPPPLSKQHHQHQHRHQSSLPSSQRQHVRAKAVKAFRHAILKNSGRQRRVTVDEQKEFVDVVYLQSKGLNAMVTVCNLGETQSHPVCVGDGARVCSELGKESVVEHRANHHGVVVIRGNGVHGLQFILILKTG